MLSGDESSVSRLVMVDVTWAYCRFTPREDPKEQAWKRYHLLISGLLDVCENVVSDSQIGVWILHNPQRVEVDYAVQQAHIDDPIFAPYRWFREQIWPKGWRGQDAQRTVDLIARGLEQCGLIATRAWMTRQQELLAAQMSLFACQLFFTPKVAAALADASMPAPAAHACIDLRFQEHHGRYWLCATLSAWTHRPPLPGLSTHDTDQDPWALPSPELTALHDPYARTLREKFKDHVCEYFHLVETEILEREHRPPQFWYARCPGLPTDPDTIKDIHTDNFNTLVNAVLGIPDVRSTGVAAGIINGQALVLRRFVPVPDPKEELPCYLVIPARGCPDDRETDVWGLVRRLTDLEASAAAQLLEVVTALDIYTSHLRVYKSVAQQADELWNQLTLYLPVAREPHLTRVHKLIELVHQTLLQGIADLDQVTIWTNEANHNVEQSASDVKDQFDHLLTERSVTEARSIRSSLIGTGYFDKASRLADRVSKDARQVQRSYQTLLDGITRAFDERRVRGTDVLQRVGIMLAVLAGMFAFLPEALNAIFTDLVTRNYHQLVLLSRFGAAVFAMLGLTLLWWKRQLSILGSRRFRKRHKQLRAFLACCATEHLTRARDVGWKQVRATLDNTQSDETRAWNAFFAEWDSLDRTLTQQCAQILDSFNPDEDYPAIRDIKTDLNKLAWRVERWALKSLLVSERPRQFREFALPRLTLLYRFYPMMDDELRSSFIDATESDIVSDSDLRCVLIDQCNCQPDEIDDIKRWAQHQIEQSRFSWSPALHFAAALNTVGLKAGMSRQECMAMLTKMREQQAARP